MGISNSRPTNSNLLHNTRSSEYSDVNSQSDADIDIERLLSEFILIIKPNSRTSISEKVFIVNKNGCEWEHILIVHNDLVDHVTNRSLSIKIEFTEKNGNNFCLKSDLARVQKIGETQFSSYCFNYGSLYQRNNRVTKYAVNIALKSYSHHLYDIIIGDDVAEEKYLDSYYTIFLDGLKKYDDGEFLKYWSLCTENTENISKVTYYILSKNDINEEHVIRDPWFALFCACDDINVSVLISKLEDLNPNINWKKLYEISNNFYKKYKYEPKHIKDALRKFPQVINQLANLSGSSDVKLLGLICQIYHDTHNKFSII